MSIIKSPLTRSAQTSLSDRYLIWQFTFFHSTNLIFPFHFIVFYIIIDGENIQIWSYCYIPYLIGISVTSYTYNTFQFYWLYMWSFFFFIYFLIFLFEIILFCYELYNSIYKEVCGFGSHLRLKSSRKIYQF